MTRIGVVILALLTCEDVRQVIVNPEMVCLWQVMSGGLLRATPHYVRAPGKDKTGGVSRNTLAIFMQPR